MAMTQAAATVAKSVEKAPPKTVDRPTWDAYLQSRDIDLRNDIVLVYSNLVRVIALKMRGVYKNYAQLDDIVNQGIIALIDAVEKFDPERNIKFETFASIKIKGAIIDFIRTQDWVPRRLRKASSDLETTHNRLCSELGREPTHAELAKAMSLTVEQLDRVMEQTWNFNLLSYEEVVWQKMSTAGGDLSVDSVEDSPERKLMEDELREQLARCIDSLAERERTVISLYYYEKLKLKEIAEVLGVSESRVCQIHSAAILKMKKELNQYVIGS